jgi:DNA-binding NarL/FixJ family response regulator
VVTDHLSNTQLRRALRATQELAELSELAEFPAQAASLLRRLIPCDIASYNAVDPSSQRVTVAADPAESLFDGGEEAFAQFAHQNPILSHYARTGDGSALRISDFMTSLELHRTELYYEVYRHISLEHQLAITVPSPRCTLGRPSEVIGLTLSRSRRDFSNTERLLLQQLRPHFAASLQRLHELAFLRAISTGGDRDSCRWLVLVGREATIAWSTPAAAEELGLVVGDSLPASLRQAVSDASAQEHCCGQSVPQSAATLLSDGLRVHVRLVPDVYPQLDALQLTPVERLPGADALRSLSLTRRQAEVLALALEGKTSVQIADALVLSPRTVEKHFDAIYARLGVGNRTQAITRALQAFAANQPRSWT